MKRLLRTRRGIALVLPAAACSALLLTGAKGCGPKNHTPDIPPPVNTGQPVNPPGPSPVGGSGQLTHHHRHHHHCWLCLTGN